MPNITTAFTTPNLPGQHFFPSTPLSIVHNATAYENVVAEYERSGDEVGLAVDLQDLGCDQDEIEWHIANPGKRMQQGWA